MDENEPAASRDIDSAEVDVPGSVEAQGVGNGLHFVESREEIEEGIARPGNEDFVSRVAQELEEEAVRFARAAVKEIPDD
jgi:hypothetical protein